MRKSTVAALCALLLFALALSGCRSSPVLEQVIYTVQTPAPVDEDNEVKQNDNDEKHEEKDDHLSSKQEDEDSDTERDREESDAVKGEDETPDAPNDAAPDIREEEHAANQGQVDPPEDTVEPDPDLSAPVDAPAAGSDYTGELRQVVDAYGNSVDVPENVDRVTAVGDSVPMVLMLGGEGRLVATNSDFANDAFCARVFGSTDAAVLWYGSGGAGIGQESFDYLLELAPDVCFVTSGVYSFSDAQLAQLRERGIACVTLPKFNNPDNIKTAATIVGQVLGDRSADGGSNAPALAEDYCKWYDGVISKVSSRVKRFNYANIDYGKDRYALRRDTEQLTQTDTGYYTLYISDWETGAAYKVYSDAYLTMEGVGMAIAPSGYSTTPFSYYMSVAGVINTAAAAPDLFALRQWYVYPIQPSTRIMEISGSKGTVTDIMLTTMTDTAEGRSIGLGEARFPALIVENSDIKTAIESDAAGRGLWAVYGPVSSADGNVSGYGFLDEIGQIVSTTIRGDYEIYVIPRGVGSWSTGTAESPLAAMWTAWKYYGEFSEDEIASEIQDFYSRFYRCELSRDEALGILAGK